MAPAFEVADVLNAHWSQVQHSGQYNTWQLRTLDAVRRCRTASLGSHVDGCSSCGHLRISYNPSFIGTLGVHPSASFIFSFE